MWVCAHACVCICHSMNIEIRGQSMRVTGAVSYNHVGPGPWTQVTRLGWKCLCLLRCLFWPWNRGVAACNLSFRVGHCPSVLRLGLQMPSDGNVCVFSSWHPSFPTAWRVSSCCEMIYGFPGWPFLFKEKADSMAHSTLLTVYGRMSPSVPYSF